MSPEQHRIEEDLRGLIVGDVRCDELFCQLYASDASIFEMRPLGVVRPRTKGDVAAVVRYAVENEIPIHARGAGSSLAGASLGRGLVVDFSRYLRRIVAIGEEDVTVQAGVVLERLNDRLARVGRRFGPDPATARVSTIGGVVGVDSSGSRWPAYGSARRHVQELEVVLADGRIVKLGRHRRAGGGDDPANR
ncbi:MAG: FAD-dependent oxidoreductase, partial [Planctomycetota bacterium]